MKGAKTALNRWQGKAAQLANMKLVNEDTVPNLI